MWNVIPRSTNTLDYIDPFSSTLDTLPAYILTDIDEYSRRLNLTDKKNRLVRIIDMQLLILVVCLVGHHMLILVRCERGKLIYTQYHVITSHMPGRCAVQNSRRVWHMKKSPHNNTAKVSLQL